MLKGFLEGLLIFVKFLFIASIIIALGTVILLAVGGL